MDLTTKVMTGYGEVQIDKLIRVYNQRQAQSAKKAEWLKTEEGKEYNRKKAAEYYAANKDEVTLKRIALYEENKEQIKAKASAYYLKNKEMIRAKANAKKAAAREEDGTT